MSEAITNGEAVDALNGGLSSHFVRFEDFYGSDFDLSFVNGSGWGDARPRINGIQIMANVPEPTSVALWILGLIGCVGLIRRRKK